MSGHSKWSTIKRKKGAEDAKKGKVFTKMASLIAIAAREGGGDVNANFKLKLAIDKAKSFNVPANNIDRAVQRGIGQGDGNALERMNYEAYGPFGVALMIQVVTDNKNRTVSVLRKILNDSGGRLVESGSVSWMFVQKGVINLLISKNKPQAVDELSLLAIDCGANDVEDDGDDLFIYTKAKELIGIKACLEKKSIKINSAEIEMSAKEEVEVGDRDSLSKIKKLMEELDNCDDVVDIYSNLSD